MGEISEALRRARDTGAAPGAPAARGTLAQSPPASLREAASAQTLSSERGEGWHSRCVLVEPRSAEAESYRHFAVRLQRAMKLRGARSVLVTSAVRGEGKTTTACNLALAVASMASGRRTALVELDLRRPTIAQVLDLTPRAGVEEVLRGGATASDACNHTQLGDLDVYVASAPAPSPLDALSSSRTPTFLRELARSYDLLILDAPPVLPVPDVPILTASADAVLFVVRAGMSRRVALLEAMAAVGKEQVIGAFLNEAATPRHRRYAGYTVDTGESGSGEKKQ